ncbi:MAG: response regulator [Oscillospiraceae bacterium]
MSDTTKKLKILICDDSALVRKQLSNILSGIGDFEIFFAENGNAAVTKYAEVLPDISFMDIVMPEKSGIDALKDIISLNPNAKVVMASSIGTQGNLKTAIECGAFDFIQKPVEKGAIEKIINKIL